MLIALPGIGHACGHNLIAICGVGVALSIRDALIKFDIPGKVVLLGTPGDVLPIVGHIEIWTKRTLKPKKAVVEKLSSSKEADMLIWMLALCMNALDYICWYLSVDCRSHPVSGLLNSTGSGSSLAIQAFEVEYFGHT